MSDIEDFELIQVYANGKITLPKHIRDKLGIKNGYYLAVYEQNGTIVCEPISPEKIAKIVKEYRLKEKPSSE